MTVTPQVKTFLLGLSFSAFILLAALGGALADRLFVFKPLDYVLGQRSVALSSVSSSSSPLAAALGQGQSIADVAEVSSQSVVTVAIKKNQRIVRPFAQGILGFLPTDQATVETRQIQQDIGTGFVIDTQGLVVTNRHVVADVAAEYIVIDKQDREYQVTKLYRDPSTDLAILQVRDLAVQPLLLGDSSELRVGQEVIAIGTALGEYRHTVTTGVVSGLGRGIQAINSAGASIESIEGVIQTDAAINPGNSGGPLLDRLGRVIGVNVAVAAGSQNIGFAIPINVIKASLDNFNHTGQFTRPYWGIRYQTITQQAAEFNQVPQGALLTEVAVEGPAARAGLLPGDIILSVAGIATNEQELASILNAQRVGETVEVRFWRAGEERTLQLKLESLPE